MPREEPSWNNRNGGPSLLVGFLPMLSAMSDATAKIQVEFEA